MQGDKLAHERGVKSVHAEEAAKKKIHHIKNHLEGIKVMLGKYESLMAFDYGRVGDLAHVERLLSEAWEFISETS